AQESIAAPSRRPSSISARRSPSSTLRRRPCTSHRNVVPSRTGLFAKRLTSLVDMDPGPTRAAITRPEDAPRSTAATETFFTGDRHPARLEDTSTPLEAHPFSGAGNARVNLRPGP